MAEATPLRIDVGETGALTRVHLGDQVAALLRVQLVRGRLRPGTKLVEREVAELLGVSRAPVRDALMQLEREGLVVTRSSGRYVVELDERQFREIFQIRLVLETLAAELAAARACPEHAGELAAKLAEMRAAIEGSDYDAFSRADMELHHVIWRQAGNERLAETLRSLLGPFFLYVASNAHVFDWETDLTLHHELVDRIVAGDSAGVRDSLRRDFAESQEALLRSLRSADGAAAGGGG